MLNQKKLWLEEEKRREQIEKSADDAQTTYFGFQRVASREKSRPRFAAF